MESKPADKLTISIASGLTLLCCATLLFEISLTRIFSVAQFYHFAFMIVSLALLGFGASGTFITLFPQFKKKNAQLLTGYLSGAAAASMLAAYILTNLLPFDSFSIAWDMKQIALLCIHYLALALPFFFSGLATGILLSQVPKIAGKTYALNMLGSASGCIIALFAPVLIGSEGCIVLSSLIASLGGCLCLISPAETGLSTRNHNSQRQRSILLKTPILLMFLLFILCSIDISQRITHKKTTSILDVHISPYKSLSYALQYPDAQIIKSQWNAFSRVDVVQSPGIRSLPGISYQYFESPPKENGLLIDGDNLSPIILSTPNSAFTDYMPAAIAYSLQPQAQTLILEPKGGLDLFIALHQNAGHITAVEANPLIISAAQELYHQDRIAVETETGRSFTSRTKQLFDVVVLSLNSTYHPINSGAYSLTEDYRYTVEAFQDILTLLSPDGLLVSSRWLQTPPSEFLRVFALAVTALENEGISPEDCVVAFRGYNQGTLLIKKNPFTAAEIETIRQFTENLSFDLVYYPGISESETNRFNRLPEAVYYQNFTSLLTSKDRSQWYNTYPYNVKPPTDNHPFFGHFFKWSQAGYILDNLGKTWQPFGGAGYFVILIFLILALILSGCLILLPVMAHRRHVTSQFENSTNTLAYFFLIGLGYLLVELPLVQYFILFLGYPAYALTSVIFTLLFFSGLGSRFSKQISRRVAHSVLVLNLIVFIWLLPIFFKLCLNLNLELRLILTAAILAPAGFLMGTMFPRGLHDLEQSNADLIPWAWGVNGAASVIASALAALLSLSFGYNLVLIVGAICYALAWREGNLIRAARLPDFHSPSEEQRSPPPYS